MSEPGANLARVLAVWGEMSQRQTMEPLADAMAEDVVWQGLLPELVCHGRDEVRGVLGSARAGRLPTVTRMEAEEVGDRVVVTVEGPTSAPGRGPRARTSRRGAHVGPLVCGRQDCADGKLRYPTRGFGRNHLSRQS